MNKDLTLDQKFKKAETINPAWERVTVFSWGDLLGMKKRIAELEQERNLAEGRIDELEELNERQAEAILKFTDRIAELEQENERLRSPDLRIVYGYDAGFREGMERAAEMLPNVPDHMSVEDVERWFNQYEAVRAKLKK